MKRFRSPSVLVLRVKAWLAVFAVAAMTVGVCAAGPATNGNGAAPGFETTVEPFLQQNCFLCHNAKLKTGGLNLQSFPDANSVAAARATWEQVEKKIAAGEMPPKGLPRPAAASVTAVTKWLDAEFQREDALAKPVAGRVTARRLNRAEYNNTIRDLLAVNTRPADQFPQDDSGYGFDDIGDVLTVSPVLMDRYLRAAEQVVHQALDGPAAMQVSLEKLRGGPGKIVHTKTAPAEYDETGLTLPNAVHAMYRFPVEGDYTIRMYPGGSRPGGSDGIQLALWLDGTRMCVVDLDIGDNAPGSTPGEQDLTGRPKECTVHVTAGEHWVAATIPHLYEGLPASYHGPKPSSRPIPKVDLSSFFASLDARKDLTPEKKAAIKQRVEARMKEVKPANDAHLSYIEVVGPYHEVMGPSEASLRKIFVCGHLDGHHNASCPRVITASFLERAFRRPVSDAEVEKYLGLYKQARREGGSFNDGIALALEGALVSPDFLFRIEKDPGTVEDGAAYPVNDFELASRLSYFLWSSMPDEELERCARNHALRNPEVLDAEVHRMLRDAKSEALVDNFGGQWLQFRALESAQPDRDKFPQFDEYLRMSMRKETEMFFSAIVHEDRSVLDFLDGNYTYVNQRLAELYGIPGVVGPEFRRVDLTGNAERGGVLGQASVLTVSSYATRTSPVIRGKWILENILNDPVPPPPPNVPNLDVAEVGTSVSLRQQLEKHRANAVCATCHSRMDPLGFGLENYNAIGVWRTKDGKFPIDASGVLPNGRKFDGPEGLKAVLLSDREAFARCMAEKMLTYALGRGVEDYDRPTVNGIVKQMAAHDYKFSSLVLGIVNSVPFQMQEEKGQKLVSHDHHS